MTGMMDEIFAKRTGICHGKGGSMHIADLKQGMLGANGIVGAGVPITAGAALTARVLRNGSVGVAFFGDGAYNEGATLETMNLARVWKLPMLPHGRSVATSSSALRVLVYRRRKWTVTISSRHMRLPGARSRRSAPAKARDCCTCT